MSEGAEDAAKLVEFIAKAIVTQPDDIQVTVADGGRVLELETASLEPPVPGAEGEEQSERLSIPLLMFPGMLLMSLLFVAQGVSEDLWKERAQGTLRLRATAASRLTRFVGNDKAYAQGYTLPSLRDYQIAQLQNSRFRLRIIQINARSSPPNARRSRVSL